MGGFIIGTLAAQLAGSWIYWQIRSPEASPPRSEWVAGGAAGLMAALVASAIYIPLGVHTWLGGEGSTWGLSIFLGVCIGICQGALFRGRPMGPPRPRP